MSEGAVLYHEPSTITILIQSSFVLTLNLVDYVLDKAVYCGLIGQILVGMAYGTPGADILGSEFQQAITDLGYVGLILIVFEGGLSTNMKALRSNFVLSLFVALTGITLPIGLSFLLVSICNATILQAFAAGCALSSTSLGTTFTILKTSGLENSRLGVVLTSAAMLDDVVGLVLVQVIANLGASTGQGISATVIVRPVFVSIGYALLVPIILFIFVRCGSRTSLRLRTPNTIGKVLKPQQIKFLLYSILLIGAVASAGYAGTSVLFAAYLVGLLISSCEDYWDGWRESRMQPKHSSTENNKHQETGISTASTEQNTNDSWELVTVKPGTVESADVSSNPITTDAASNKVGDQNNTDNSKLPSPCASTQTEPGIDEEEKANTFSIYYAPVVSRLLKGFFFGSIGLSIPITRLFNGPTLWRGFVYFLLMAIGKLACGIWLVRLSSAKESSSQSASRPAKVWSTLAQLRPQSLYPASILGNAMVARGEIGFLISAIAQSNGIFTSSSANENGDIFLIVTWAILLCTIVGPISVGLLTRRVKRLRKSVSNSVGGRADPLGIWADI